MLRSIYEVISVCGLILFCFIPEIYSMALGKFRLKFNLQHLLAI